MAIFNFKNNTPSETFPTGSVTILPDYSNVNNALTNADFDPPEQKTTNFQDLSYTQLKVEFVKGWNMFAYPGFEPMDVVDFFNLISDDHIRDILIVKDNDGNFYWPEFVFNGIGNFIPGQGYQMKLPNNSKLVNRTFTPDLVSISPNLDSPPSSLVPYLDLIHEPTITLQEGWNTIGYNRQKKGDATLLFYKSFYPDDSISRSEEYMMDKLDEAGIQIAKNNDGRILMPIYIYNGIGDLLPGQGYQIRMAEQVNDFKFPPLAGIDIRPLIDGGPR